MNDSDTEELRRVATDFRVAIERSRTDKAPQLARRSGRGFPGLVRRKPDGIC